MTTERVRRVTLIGFVGMLALVSLSILLFARGAGAAGSELLPESTFVIVNDVVEQVGQAVTPEVTDNRTSVPYVVGETGGRCALVGGSPYVDPTELCQALGLEIASSCIGGTYMLSGEGFSLRAVEGDAYFIFNNRYLHVPHLVQADGSSILLPMEAMSKCLGIGASWDRAAWLITVRQDGISPLESGDTYYDENDVYWLSRIINAEAGNDTLEEKLAIGNVVLNRRADSSFAGQDTVYDVVFAKNQFDVAINGMIYMEPDELSVIAAKLALEGYDIVEGATYFGADALEGYQCVAKIGDNYYMTLA